MSVSPELRNQILTQAQGALALYAAFVGGANPLFATLVKIGKSTPEELAKQTGLDPGYVSRWCDAAFLSQACTAAERLVRKAVRYRRTSAQRLRDSLRLQVDFFEPALALAA